MGSLDKVADRGAVGGAGLMGRLRGRHVPRGWWAASRDVLVPARAWRPYPSATGIAAFLAALLPCVALAHPHGTVECGVLLHFEAGRPVAAEQRLRLDEPTSGLLVGRLQLTAETPAPDAMQGRALMAGLFRRAGWLLDLRPHDGADLAPPLAVEHDDPARWSVGDDGRVLVVVALRLAAAPAGKRWKLGCVDPEWYWQGEFESVTPVRVEGAACGWQPLRTQGAAAAPATPVPSFATPPLASAERPPGLLVPALGVLECGG